MQGGETRRLHSKAESTQLLRRRRVLQGALGATVGAALGWLPGGFRPHVQAQATSEAPQGGASIELLRGGVYRLTVANLNLVAVAARGASLLVDGGPAQYAADVERLVARLPSGGPVATLFNTCWHRTQTGLNETARRNGGTVIAHENARLWLTTDVTWPWDGTHFEPLPETAHPNRTFYGREALDIDGRQIEYGHVRACPHTDGDAYVHFRDAGVIAVGNAITGAGWPSIDWWTGGWLGGIVGALELFLSISDRETLVVPAHGPVLGRAELEAQHQMYDLLYERLVDLLYSGKSPAEAVAARPAAEFEPKYGSSDEFVARAFQSLWGYLTPDA